MARYSMYSGEQIETHVADDFDTRAGVVRPLQQSEDLALLTSTSDILRPNISGNSSSRRHNGTENYLEVIFRHVGNGSKTF